MDVRDRSLDLREAGGSPARGGIWTVISDVALALVLVLVLFVLAQFLHYDKVAVLEEIDRRRHVVESLVIDAAGTVLAPAELAKLEVESRGFTSQRIRFPEAMLFGSCEVVPRPEGTRLIEAVGRAIGGRVSYFEAVQIEGHADRRPPGGDCERRVIDNWGLSSARATAFVRDLIQPGVFSAPAIVSSVGRGDTQPLNGANAAGPDFERDRRVELIIIYSETDASYALAAAARNRYGNPN
jgi:hypothetical protein